MALRPYTLYLVSRFALAGPWLWAVSEGLSGYCPGQYPSMYPPLSCRGRQLISADTCPPTPAPSPENSYCGHYSLVCVIVQVWRADVCDGDFWGHVSGEGANAQHALRIDAVTILSV